MSLRGQYPRTRCRLQTSHHDPGHTGDHPSAIVQSDINSRDMVQWVMVRMRAAVAASPHVAIEMGSFYETCTREGHPPHPTTKSRNANLFYNSPVWGGRAARPDRVRGASVGVHHPTRVR